MKDTQLQALLTFLENSAYKAFKENKIPQKKQELTNLYYSDDLHPQHTFDVIYPDHQQNVYPFILYIHGGGFCMHSKDDLYHQYALQLASDDFAVVNMNYRLAPDAIYQDIINDLHHMLTYLLKYGASLHLDVTSMFVAGDSAGAYLATYLPFLVSQYPSLHIKAIASCCGLFDFHTFLEDKECKFPIKKQMIQLLFRDTIPYYSSIPHLMHDNYPPIYLMDSCYQSFCGEAKRMQYKLAQHHIPYRLHLFDKAEKLPHNFQLLSKYPQSDLVLQEILQFFRSQSLFFS